MVDFAIKRGDNDPLEVRLHSDHATSWTLSGSNVVFNMRKQGAASNKVTRGACEIIDAVDRTVRYRFTAADMNEVGLFNAEFEETTSDGIVRTFPSGKDDDPVYCEVQVKADLG